MNNFDNKLEFYINRVKTVYEKVNSHIGCGDHSCKFIKPKGMGTNGICRCKNAPLAISSLAELYKVVGEMLKFHEDDIK